MDALIQELDHLLLGCLRQNTPPPFFEECVRMLRASQGMVSLRELSRQSDYSARHLNRTFHDYLGMSGKKFSGLLRVNHAIRNIKEPGVSLTELALASGFYDQSHFIHVFRSVCGVTPTVYLQKLSAFYNEPYKL